MNAITPITAPCQQKNEPGFTPLEKLWHFQHVVRRWKGSLTPHEFRVIMEVVDRTIMWSRERCVMRVQEVSDACCMSDRHVRRLMDGLEARGILKRERPGHWAKYNYRINFDWRPEPVTLPKGTPGKGKLGIKAVSESGQGDSESYHILDSGVARSSNGSTSRPGGGGSLAEVAEGVRSAATHEHKRWRSKMTTGAFRSTWEAAWLGHYRDAPAPWGAKELSQAKLVMRKWGDGRTEDFHDMVAYAIANWSTINDGMRGRGTTPARPHVGWFLSLYRMFSDAWYQREESEHARHLPEVERLQAQAGMTYEQALVEVGRQQALGEQRTALAHDIAVNDAKIKKLEALERKVGPVARTGAAPRPKAIIAGRDHWSEGGGATD